MLKFIIQRIRNLVPILFGISILTFALIHVVPLDPVTINIGSTGLRIGNLNSTILEEFKRTYFLHLPLFINLKPEDLPVRVNKLWEKIKFRQSHYQDAERDLIHVGGAAFPFLLSELKKSDQNSKEKLIYILNEISKNIKGFNLEDFNNQSSEQYWLRFWEDNRLDYMPQRAQLLVKRLIKSNHPLSEQELLKLDTFALPFIMEHMFDENISKQALFRLTSVAHDITQRGDIIDTTEADPEIRQRMLQGWNSWWQTHYYEYTRFSPLKRMGAVITETQYFKWIERFLTLDFGLSLKDNQPVITKIKEKIWVTLLLTIFATFIAYIISIPLGIVLGVKDGKLSESIISILLFILYSLPTFWVAMLLLRYLTGGDNGILLFPLGGIMGDGFENKPLFEKSIDIMHHLILPVLCLSYVSISWLSRYQKVAMLEVLYQDYIRTARAKGLGKFAIMYKHALRNAIIPIITLFGLQFPFLIGGSVIIEKIFQIPGMGLETFEAIRYMDYNWIMGVTTIISISTMIGILISDILYALIDPRFKEEIIKEVNIK